MHHGTDSLDRRAGVKREVYISQGRASAPRQAIRQAHGPEQSRRARGGEPLDGLGAVSLSNPPVESVARRSHKPIYPDLVGTPVVTLSEAKSRLLSGLPAVTVSSRRAIEPEGIRFHGTRRTVVALAGRNLGDYRETREMVKAPVILANPESLLPLCEVAEHFAT